MLTIKAELLGREAAKVIVGQADVANGHAQQFKYA